MKKLQKRAIICLCFAFILIIGTGFYIEQLAVHGDEWVSYPANKHVFTKGRLSTGVIKDRDGNILISNSKDGETKYNDDYDTRKAMVHVTGDSHGNIATGANVVFRDKMVGYNFITGIYSASGEGRTINLTVDNKISKIASDALGSRRGTVGIYNYRTGDIICMVSSPNYDPYSPPKLDSNDTSGTYLNRFTSTAMVPGSILKLITSTAVIEEIPDIANWSYNCTGSEQYGNYEGDKITCLYPHGRVTFEEALAHSCNCAFGELSKMVGPGAMKKYTEMAGLTNSYNINGIHTKPSSFDFGHSDVNLAWSGIGQGQDLVNPCSMMVYMGAVANGGKAANPKIIESIEFSNGMPASHPFKTDTKPLINSDTASRLTKMMRNNVITDYGEDTFPGLNICAKSGTAQPDKTSTPHAWFTGFLDDPKHPYAFIVLVENGGYGTEVAGNVANTVLQKIVNED